MNQKLDFGKLPAPDGQNGWWEILAKPLPAKRYSGQQTFDYVVIGGGITGLCAARRLAELSPESTIALVEADRIGRSTAGRNSGFFVDLPHDISSDSYSKSVEEDQADVRFQRHGIDYVRSIVKAHQIDCDWRDEGKFHAWANPRGEKAVESFTKGLKRIGEPFTMLDKSAIKGVTGSDFYLGGMHTPGCSTAQPAALMRGLALNMPANVSVFEESPVLEMTNQRGVQLLRFQSGSITAKQVLLCTNAYAADRKNGLLPVYTYASLSRELTNEEVLQLGGQRSWALIPADPMGTTVRRLGFNRICIRNHFSYRPGVVLSAQDLAESRHLHQRSFERRFPMLSQVNFEYTWGGALCLTTNNGVYFGKRDQNVYQSIGCNGLGLSRGSTAGKLLAEYVLGQPNDLIEHLLKIPTPKTLPLQPFSGVAVKAAIAFKEKMAGIEM
ncbi:FAD-binding oxidoreductase [Leeia sp. TBRC 13508]|uniref:FAD-binding oxidoreductase n=1 Tax=Leeia speluncae TaxID=2884804 RepID=A0ABS8D1M7_9NEIS|nr:FAD-binding oxidoreductase [Leeia speluncae]MCB6182090.1 FAD-binding oxidoreductase [Leeia speluncae]